MVARRSASGASPSYVPRLRPVAWLMVAVLLFGVFQALASRAQSQETVVSLSGFELRCPSNVNEGTTVTCTLTNLDEAGAPWPVVAMVHLSTDENRALVRGSPLDARIVAPSPSADIDGGVDWVGDTLVAYSRFDWSGDAPAAGAEGDSRNVQIVIEADDDFEAKESFYVALAPDGRTALGPLLTNSGEVGIVNTDTKTNDARLSDLGLSGGASVSFSPDTTSYAVAVSYDATDLVLTPTANHERATIAVAGTGEGGALVTGLGVASGEGSHALPLDVGMTTLQVEVTAEDGTTKTYTVTVTRAARPASVTVESGSFRLECPATADEGSDLTCTLSNTSSSAQPWPVVAILHSSANLKRALISEDPLLPDTDPLFSKDLNLADPQTPAVADYNYNYGYGELFSGESRSLHTVYGYEKFDWDGDAPANGSRSVVIRLVDDEIVEGDEVFYVALAPDGYTGLTDLTRNKAPIVVKGLTVTGLSASDVSRTAATVSVGVSGALASDSLHLRYRVAGSSGSWMVAGPEPVSGGVAWFTLSGLAPGTVYVLGASLDAGFATTVGGQLTTLGDPPSRGGNGDSGGGGGGSGGGGRGSGGGGRDVAGEEEPPEAESDEELDVAPLFEDVPADAWYRQALAWALDRAVTRGCRDGFFCPNDPVKRGQFVTLLWRAAGEPVPNQLGSQIFADVTEGSYADAAIGWAVQQGITVGCGRGARNEPERRFCPSDAAIRAHIVVFLYRFAGGDEVEALSIFADVPTDSYFASAVAWAAGLGITAGCDAELFCPAALTTRTHVVVFLYRMASLLGSFGESPQSTGGAP